MKWAVTRLCGPTGYGDYLWAGRPMFSAVGLFLGLKSKSSHEQNVIYFQFYIRLPNCRLLGSIIFKKSPIRSIPLSILYRLFFETQGRKYGRILSWSCIYSICIHIIFHCPQKCMSYAEMVNIFGKQINYQNRISVIVDPINTTILKILNS